MWALQDESIQGSLDHGLQRLAYQLLLRHTHMCVRCRKHAGLIQGTKGYKGCGPPSAAVSIHMCVSQKQFKVAPKDQRLHGIGRPTAAVSIHMCVADYINSGFHLSVKGYNVARTHMCVAEKINSGLV